MTAYGDATLAKAADPAAIHDLVAFCDKAAWLLDDCLRIPGTRFRFGLDALIGLFPVAGDAVGFAVSSLTIFRAARAGVPRRVLAKMGGNMVIDLFGSIVPVVGDVFDTVFKAHRRNFELLRKEYALPDTTTRKRAPLTVRIIGALIVAAIGWAIWHAFKT
jgi:hypothetical protein